MRLIVTNPDHAKRISFYKLNRCIEAIDNNQKVLALALYGEANAYAEIYYENTGDILDETPEYAGKIRYIYDNLLSGLLFEEVI